MAEYAYCGKCEETVPVETDHFGNEVCGHCSSKHYLEPKVEYITVKPDTDACERIIREIEEYKWRKANELSEGAFFKEQAE